MSEKALPPPGVPATFKERWDVVVRARRGDPTAVPLLRKILDWDPGICEWADFAFIAEYTLLKQHAGDDLAMLEGSTHHLEKYAKELAGDNPTPMERMLARRAAFCWYQVSHYEALYDSNRGKLSLAQADSAQKRIDRSHQRFLGTMKALAYVRKMAAGGPSVQVNVNQTVNVDGSRSPLSNRRSSALPAADASSRYLGETDEFGIPELLGKPKAELRA